MSRLSEIKTAIKSLCESVPGIGNVYPRARYAKDIATIRLLFKVDNEFRGCMFSLESKKIDDSESGTTTRKFIFTVFRQINDLNDSETSFDTVLEQLTNLFYLNGDLNGAVNEHKNLQLIRKGEAMFADVLCHVAELELEAEIDYDESDFDDLLVDLAAPVLSTPPNGGTTSEARTAFQWNDVTGAEFYRLQLATDVNFLGIVLDVDRIHLSSFTIPLDEILSDGIYYWRVQAKTGLIESAWSTIFDFTVNSVEILPLTPLEIGSCLIWLKPETGITTVAGNKVSQWADQSGNNRHVIQSTDAWRPVLVTESGTGKQAIKWTLIDANTKLELHFNDPTDIFSLNGKSLTYMITFKEDVNVLGTYGHCFLAHSNTNGNWDFWFNRSAYQFAYKGMNYGGVRDINIPVVNQQLHNLIITATSVAGSGLATMSYYLDGVKMNENAEGSLIVYAPHPATYLVVGQGRYGTQYTVGTMNGWIFEVAIWEKILTDSEIMSVNKYHKNFFGL